jgi:dTDP-4-dehydrorhamnose reductase
VEHDRLMRVLVTGAGGQLGHDVVDAFAGDDVVACDHAALDVGDRDLVLAAMFSVRPDVVVHAAAWTAVDACEGDPLKAFRVNALGTRHIAEAARRTGAHVVYVSTDYVFDGTSSEPYREWDTTNPQSVYGRSKLAGEAEIGPEGTIVRTAWVCGAHGNNFVRTMLRLSTERDTWGVVNDQRGSPSFTPDIAATIRRLAVDRRPGIFHVTNQGTTTWFDLARDVLRLAGADPERVTPISTADYNAAAPRPANSVLDNGALRESGLPLLPDYPESLELLVKELTA